MVIPEAIGGVLFVSITSSGGGEHGGVLMVHRSVALLPAGTPVTPDVGDEGLVILAVPLTTLHNPVPGAGELPARVKLPLLQLF